MIESPILECEVFFFVFDMSIQEGEGGIRISDICFIRCGFQPIELHFKDLNVKL
jgi:hypothetical protein